MALTSYPDSEDPGWRKALAAQSNESQQPAVSSDGGLPWWPMALSETLKSGKPLGVSLGDRRIVRFPPIYRAESYGVCESGGFIRLCLSKDAPPPQPEAERHLRFGQDSLIRAGR